MYEEVYFRNGFGIMKLNVQIERSDFFLEKDMFLPGRLPLLDTYVRFAGYRWWTHIPAWQQEG